MSKAYQFPRDEPNPFAEPIAAQTADGQDAANPYHAGQAEAERVRPTAGTYQQTLPPRDSWLLAVSLSSLVAAFLSLGLAYFFIPVGLIALPLSGAAWWMAWHDLAAMHAGAMGDSARGRVRGALWLSIVGTVLSLLSLGSMIFWLFYTLANF
jgi:hypothetical protein